MSINKGVFSKMVGKQLKTNRLLQPSTIKTKTKIKTPQNPRKGESDFQSYHIITTQCLFFNNKNIKAYKKIGKQGLFSGKG